MRGLSSRRRRRHRPGRHADAGAAARARFPGEEIVPFASARSVGRSRRRPDGADLTVQGLDEESIQGFDLALFSAGGSTSGEWAPRFAAAGAVVVDNSSRWRMKDDVHSSSARSTPRRSPTTAGSWRTRTARRCRWSSPCAAARRGRDRAAGDLHLPGRLRHRQAGCRRAARAVTRAAPRARDRRRRSPTPTRSPSTRCPTPARSPTGDDHTDEERKLIDETRKILGDPSIRVQRDLRTCAGHQRPLRGRQRADPRAPLPRTGTGAAARPRRA